MSINKQVSIDHILPFVRKPGRYIGGELNSVSKSMTGEEVSFCLIFPDLYEIGMSHLGLQILYHILNQRQDAIAHRCFTPDMDMEEKLREKKIPLFSLETRLPLTEYDVLGITLPYELCYTNILTVLDLAGLAIYSSERKENDPLVIGGGAGAFNPEPVADFFDAIVLGDGEEIVHDLTETILKGKKEHKSRAELVASLAEIPGVYVPSFFLFNYDGNAISSITPLVDDYQHARRRVLKEMPSPELLNSPIVPVVKPIHDRLGIEIARGCTRGCRFCQAGMIYRPVRERSIEDIMAIANGGVASSGFDELALLSLSTGDYSCLELLITDLMNRFADEYVSVSMPSMRVGTLTPEIMDQIKRVRKTGFTVAPEAGTDRLRQVINKGITEEDLLQTCRDAFSLGWNLIKFYFMIGLPTETVEDVEGIVELAKKAKFEAGKEGNRKASINVSIGTFVPKPHTPFQWEKQLDIEESRARINLLKKLLPRKGFKLKWHDPEQSFLEGVFSRGDRRLAPLILKAWQNGSRLDSWSEHFSLANWFVAAEQCQVNMEEYLRQRADDEILPWDHLQSGVDKEFLHNEKINAWQKKYTEDCRNHGCQGCGLCDFKEIQPKLISPPEEESVKEFATKASVQSQEEQVRKYIYKVTYSRIGDSRFYGHLEILQLVFRVLHRVGLPVLFSQGFNPSPKVSFSQALPVGVESLVEFFHVELSAPIQSNLEIIDAFNRELPSTINVSTVTLENGIIHPDTMVTYQIVLDDISEEVQQEIISRFLEQKQCIIERVRKRKKRELDLRSFVSDMRWVGTGIELDLFHFHGKAGTNPREILVKGLGLSEEQALLARIKKAFLIDLIT